MQTLVHEMVHLWQAHFGKPGRGRYHNGQWADKMEAIGLMPSSTGKPGGQRTGDCMADYAIEGGRFLQACAALVTADFRISWYDRFPAPEVVAAGQQCEAMQLSAAVGGGSTPRPGEITFPILQAHCGPGFALSDAEVLRAMRHALLRLKLAPEPGGTVALAAALFRPAAEPGLPVIAVVSGGNADPDMLLRALQAE